MAWAKAVGHFPPFRAGVPNLWNLTPDNLRDTFSASQKGGESIYSNVLREVGRSGRKDGRKENETHKKH